MHCYFPSTLLSPHLSVLMKCGQEQGTVSAAKRFSAVGCSLKFIFTNIQAITMLMIAPTKVF